jgi:hypothetical protein
MGSRPLVYPTTCHTILFSNRWSKQHNIRSSTRGCNPQALALSYRYGRRSLNCYNFLSGAISDGMHSETPNGTWPGHCFIKASIFLSLDHCSCALRFLFFGLYYKAITWTKDRMKFCGFKDLLRSGICCWRASEGRIGYRLLPQGHHVRM